MPDQIQEQETPAFAEYACSIGTVIGHDGANYLVRLADGRVIGVLSASEPSAENVEADIASPAVPVPPVPAEVSPLQMRLALNASGLRSTVEAAVSAADQQTKDAWEFASVIRRDNALLAGMSAALGLTSAQVDDLFRLAASMN